MLIAAGIATAVLVVVTLLPLTRHQAWWVRGWDFPRLQLAVIAAGLAIGLGACVGDTPPWVTLAALAAAGCLLYHLAWIVRYTPLWRCEVRQATPGGTRVRIMAANVLMTNRNTTALTALVRQHAPDILVTLETDSYWEEALDALQADYPYSVRCPQDNLYGMHLYSRLPLSDSETRFLVEDDKPSIHTLVNLPDDQCFRLHCLHPAPPSPTENEASTERDTELVAVGKSVADATTPVIVTGDLNDVAWSATTRLFRRVSGLLDPRVGRSMLNTFHADYWFIRWPLDHLFHSREFALVFLQRLGGFGSDHFALLSELALYPRAMAGQNPPPADEAADERAEEILAEQDVTAADVPQPGVGGVAAPT